ncbi:hypothetical protein FF041_18665, partial [Streptomyces jumonjinensis]|nr:hypothetical protein [Streptomyces jumonjinensis]
MWIARLGGIMNGKSVSTLPLFDAQEGIWLAQRFEGSRRLYSAGQYIDIHGPIDTSVFERALRQAVAETEILHMRFVEDGDKVSQIVVPALEWDLPIIDLQDPHGLRALSEHGALGAEGDPRAVAEAWMRADARREIGTQSGRLFSYALFRLAPDHYIWYQSYDHLLMDAYGCSLVGRRVAAIYTALLHGRPYAPAGHASLHELMEQESAYRASEQYAHDRRYWHEHFADRPDLAGIPGHGSAAGDEANGTGGADGADGADESGGTGGTGGTGGILREAGHLPPSAVAALRATAARAQVSWPRIVVAAAAALTARMTGSDEAVLSLPVAGRMSDQARRTPCTMANILPFRLPVTAGMTFLDLAQDAGREIESLLDHQGFRGERLRRELNWPSGDRWHFGPSVNVMPMAGGILRFGEHRGIVRDLSSRRVEDFGVMVSGWSADDGMRISLEANSTMYDRDWIQASHRSFLTLLGQAAADPQLRLSELDVLAGVERSRVVEGGSGAARPVSAGSVVEAFEG